MPIGLKQDVEPGKAQILCCVDGEKIRKSYDVNIKAVHLDHDNIKSGNRIGGNGCRPAGADRRNSAGDERLANPAKWKDCRSGDSCLVNDPTRGYGIFIENMLEH